MEIFLTVFLHQDKSFTIYRSIRNPIEATGSVLKLDYNYTPWPRIDGNLLWQ